jgi:hypothetical protein
MNRIRIRNSESRTADPDLNPEGQLIFNPPDPEQWFTPFSITSVTFSSDIFSSYFEQLWTVQF